MSLRANGQNIEVQIITSSMQQVMAVGAAKTGIGMQKTTLPQDDGMVGNGLWARIKRGITLDSGSSVFVMPSGWLPQFRRMAGAKKGKHICGR